MDIKDVRNVTVAGGGTQGSQIASQIAYKGFDVTVWVRSGASIERARPRFERVYGQYHDALEAMRSGDADAYCRGLSDTAELTSEQVDKLKAQAAERLGAISFETDYDRAFGNADVVIECINENPAEKTAFYTELAKHLPERTVLLTDSSTFLPSMFAEATGRPDRYMSFHFANQIWRNNITELMRQSQTSDETFAFARAFAEAIGMIPLMLNKEQPGYILNSLLIPWFKAACALVATGVADVETVDRTWTLSTGADFEQAPFRKLDRIGLPLAWKIMSMDPASKDPSSPVAQSVALLKGYIDAGKTGVAAGEGFYSYK